MMNWLGERSTIIAILILATVAILALIFPTYSRELLAAALSAIVPGGVPDALWRSYGMFALRALRLFLFRLFSSKGNQKGSTMSFEDILDRIKAAEEKVEQDGLAAIAASKSAIGKTVVSAMIAELPVEDQPLANAIYGVATDPSAAAIGTAIRDAVAMIRAARAAEPPAPVTPA